MCNIFYGFPSKERHFYRVRRLFKNLMHLMPHDTMYLRVNYDYQSLGKSCERSYYIGRLQAIARLHLLQGELWSSPTYDTTCLQMVYLYYCSPKISRDRDGWDVETVRRSRKIVRPNLTQFGKHGKNNSVNMVKIKNPVYNFLYCWYSWLIMWVSCDKAGRNLFPILLLTPE